MKLNRHEEILELCNKLNFTLVDYGDPIMPEHHKKQIYVRFVCNAHQKYGIQEKSIYDLKRLRKPCKYCNHSMLHLTFKEEMYEINPNIEVLSEYINSEIKIKCRCKIDGYEWESSPMSLLHQKVGCKLCGYKKSSDAIRAKMSEKFIRQMQEVNSDIEIVGEYAGAHSLIRCKCKIDNEEWESYACNLLNKSAGCPECAKRRVRDIEALTVDEINQRLQLYGVSAKVIDGYTNNKCKVKCLCTVHNIEYMAAVKTLLYNKSSACPECSQSLGENKMLKILTDMGYDIKPQHSFDDCRHINVLRFDVYIECKNMVFEYQGQQHYYPVDFAGKGDEWAREQLEITQTRDNIKREFCTQHNIKMVEVPYWEFDNMESFLRKQIE